MPEQDSLLAAMISTVAEGKPLTALQQAHMRVLTVDAVRDRGLSWGTIAAVYGYPSGRQAKKIIHDLRERVQRELRLAQNRDAKVTP